jgi:hypothetical protein
MILLGSHALNYYISLDRKKHDWDFLMTAEQCERFKAHYKDYLVKETEYSFTFEINNEIVEVRNPQFLDESDYDIMEMTDYTDTLDTPFGLARVPSIQVIYDMKKATALCIDELKHKHDLKLIEGSDLAYALSLTDTEFYLKRLKETQTRVAKSNKVKYDFFHKYHIPEYVMHDRIHDMFAELLDLNIPTYQRITVAETDISETLFNKLTHDQKISLMVEEVLVLNMERWFIPQMVENGINHRLINHFYNNNEAMPTYLILKHVCITGLKGEAEFITNFSRNNFFEIEKKWIEAKEKIREKGGLPNWFFNELFALRAKYRNNESVGIK